MKRIIYINSKGLTIIELLIALGILSIVLALGYPLFYFGSKSFDDGTTQAHLQQNARLIDEYIKNELRNTGELMGADGIEDFADYDFIKIENRVFYKNASPLTDSVVDSVEIQFTDSLILYSIKCTENGQEYTLENQLLLNNNPYIDYENIDGNKDYLNDGFVLYYREPQIIISSPGGSEEQSDENGNVDEGIELTNYSGNRSSINLEFNKPVFFYRYAINDGDINTEVWVTLDPETNTFTIYFSPELSKDTSLTIALKDDNSQDSEAVFVYLKVHGQGWGSDE